MARKWYGSVNNRINENRQFCDKIEVGTGMTEYLWSDSHAYEVTRVKDQKHVWVREYDVKHVGEPYTNNWELISNPENPEEYMTKRGNYWYRTVVITADDVKEIEARTNEAERVQGLLWLCHNDVNKEDVLAKGKVTKYHRENVSFGVADYYYDYEF